MNLHRFLIGLPGALGVVVVVGLPIYFEDLIESDPRGAQKADLLRFAVLNIGAALERIKVVFRNWLLDELRLRSLRSFHVHGPDSSQHPFVDSVHLARDELELRIPEGRSAFVDDRHPTV